jgi:hypothetical protein
MEPIEIEFQLTKPEYIALMRKLTFRRRNTRAYLAVYAAMAIVGAVAAFFSWYGFVVLGVGAYSAVYVIWIFNRIPSRIWDRTPGSGGVTTVVASESGLEARRDMRAARIARTPSGLNMHRQKSSMTFN